MKVNMIILLVVALTGYLCYVVLSYPINPPYVPKCPATKVQKFT
jgi:hypothetical protein